MVGNDMIHGVHTQLPIPLALSCSWDDGLWFRAGDLIGRETPLKGCNWTFSPMVDISRDARWDRIAEGPGQDAYLASRMSAAMVRGIQSDKHVYPVAACLKHYLGYGAAIGGRDYNAVEMSESTLRNVYLPPFKAGVEAGALTVMPAFHSLNGVACSVNRWILEDILRGELGFRGFTVSDYNAIGECGWANRHGMSDDGAPLAAMALDAGMCVDMMSETYEKYLKEAVEKGLVAGSTLDKRVREVLRVKNALGLFETPYIDERAVRGSFDFEDHIALAREAAAKCCVLLKNENGTLPLKPGVKVALVGPGAEDLRNFMGCWVATRVENDRNGTIVGGLRADGVDFTYVPGYGFDDEPVDDGALVAALSHYEGSKLVNASGRHHCWISGDSASGRRLDIDL